MPNNGPSFINSKKGFTLIELLVVITIIAILSVIGITVYTSLQSGARDARRRVDIESVSKTLEANYNISNGEYKKLLPTHFAGGGIPADPKVPSGTACTPATAATFYYCLTTTTSGGAILTADLASSSIPAVFVKYTVCARLEQATTGNSYDNLGAETSYSGATSKDFYCRKNQQ